MFRYLPEQGSEFAPDVDWLHHLITDISVFFTVAIVGAMIYFAIKYRRRDGVDHETPQILGSHFLEILWTVVPTIICVYLGYWGIVIYREMRAVPTDALVIDVTGQKWKWDFQYPNGKKTVGELVVPVNAPIKLVLTSKDVLHSFFLPTMRVKKDAIPNQYTYLYFRPVSQGEFNAFCTEYCGKDHSQMLAKLRVVSATEYEHWVNDRSEEELMAKLGPAERGKALYTQKGCNACHSLNGTRLVGPSFLKLYGKNEKLADGSEVLVDDAYLQESIIEPAKRIVATYPAGAMPAYAGQLSADDVHALISFIRAQDGSAVEALPAKVENEPDANLTPVQKGEKIYRGALACMGCHSLDGNNGVGPSFKGIYGRKQKMSEGSIVTTDDAYLKESILNSNVKVVDGFQPVMPPFQGVLKDEDVQHLIEFLKTVK